MSDGAVRAQRWYLKQRPCRYCCEGCWQIALSRSISMKNEISASCENSAPQGLRGSGFPLAFGSLQKFHGMHSAKSKPKFLCRELLSAPSQVPSAWAHKLLVKHSSHTKEQG